jgi:SAM-dependent methyltransferase
MFGTGEVFDYVECGQCGSLRIDTIPEQLSSYYGSGYYTNLGSRSRVVGSLLARRDAAAFTRRGVVGRLVDWWQPNSGLRVLARADIRKDARILDVGCGSGSMLRSMAAAGHQNLIGVDPFVEQDIHCNGKVLVRKGRVGDLSGPYDLVMFHHSLEHMADPADSLREARRLLDDETGRCLVRVPTVSSWAWRQYGTAWIQLDPPRHLFVPSMSGLETALGGAGFEIERVEYDSTGFQIWGSEQAKRGIAVMSWKSVRMNPLLALARGRALASAARAARSLNVRRVGDQIAVWARPGRNERR